MTKQEQYTFITELTNKVKKDLQKIVKYLPDEWDGVELRWLIRDYYTDVVIKNIGSSIRKRNYNRYIINGLLEKLFNLWGNMKTLTIKVEGKTKESIKYILEEITKLIDNGYTLGRDISEDGEYTYNIKEE